MTRAEQQIHCAIIKHLELRGAPELLWLHINNNPRSAKDGARLKRMGMQKGAPDLLYFFHGQYIAHEIKTRTGGPSKAQWDFLHRFGETGGVVIVTYGLDHALEMLVNLGLIRET